MDRGTRTARFTPRKIDTGATEIKRAIVAVRDRPAGGDPPSRTGPRRPSELEKVLEQLHPAAGEDGFGVELDPPDRELPVADRLDFLLVLRSAR